MDVLLARPPRRDRMDAGLAVPPLGLAYIAGALEAAGVRVDLLDACALGWDWSRFEAELARRRPAVLGLSAMTPVADISARAAQLARPYVGKIVLGGPHPTALGRAILSEIPELDAAVVGEGEDIAPALIRWWEAGSNGPPPPGCLVAEQPFTPAEPPEVHRLARPARHLLPNDKYRYLFATQPGFGTMITSRGCPFRCSFCDKSVGGSRWRARDAEDVVDELLEMRVRYGVRFVNFYDDNFTLRRERVVKICERILSTGLSIEWKCEGRVDGVDLPLLRLMRRAGCRTVAFGVESGNQATLDLLRKDVRVDQAPAAFAACRAAGLRTLAYMILGAPGEGPTEVDRSIQFCRELGADYVQFSSLVALPGTPLFLAHDPAGVANPNPLDADLHRATCTDLPPDVLQEKLRQAWTGFYFRPRALRRLAGDVVASGSLGEGLRLGLAFGRWHLQA